MTHDFGGAQVGIHVCMCAVASCLKCVFGMAIPRADTKLYGAPPMQVGIKHFRYGPISPVSAHRPVGYGPIDERHQWFVATRAIASRRVGRVMQARHKYPSQNGLLCYKPHIESRPREGGF